MMEARGLPPHLLGSLGSKMHYILHKSFSSSMSSSNSEFNCTFLTIISSSANELEHVHDGTPIYSHNIMCYSGMAYELGAAPSIRTVLSYLKGEYSYKENRDTFFNQDTIVEAIADVH